MAHPPFVVGPEHAARVLLTHGSVRQAIALLRGTIARDKTEDSCHRLLKRALRGDMPPTPSGPLLDLNVVDRWIRGGMLVEALALLDGTAMGTEDTGREWANLLGELLAPVPVDAEACFKEAHLHLLTGGASLALTTLERRSESGRDFPAWAARRLSLLRWMLLDNAQIAQREESEPPASTPLAAALRAGRNQTLTEIMNAARRYANQNPDDVDGARTARALETLVDEVQAQSSKALAEAMTMPMVAHPAAGMQLQMGNFNDALEIYERLLDRDPKDHRAAYMMGEVEIVLRALASEQVVSGRRPTAGPEIFAVDSFPVTQETELPEGQRRPTVIGEDDTTTEKMDHAPAGWNPEGLPVTRLAKTPRSAHFSPQADHELETNSATVLVHKILPID